MDRLHLGRLGFQIAAHEETIPLDELYGASEIDEILAGKHAVGRGSRGPSSASRRRTRGRRTVTTGR